MEMFRIEHGVWRGTYINLAQVTKLWTNDFMYRDHPSLGHVEDELYWSEALEVFMSDGTRLKLSHTDAERLFKAIGLKFRTPLPDLPL
jgi:hypothetical protein